MESNIKNKIIVYDNGEIELKISLEKETLWLTQKQISLLFNKDIRTINNHIKSIYKEEELLEKATIRKYRIVQKEGLREVSRDVFHYNLDAVISVGYRVNSKKATNFRKWATYIIKEYISNGYIINSNKITNERFIKLENNIINLQNRLQFLENKNIKPSEGIFFDGEVFDAYKFISDLIKSAKTNIILIDNYIDETILTLFIKNQNVKVTIYTATINKQLKLDLQKYNSQYNNISIKEFKNSHDRFLIIDKTEVYHIGASLKDLGKKWFAFSKLDISSIMILNKLNFNKSKNNDS